MPKIGSKKVEDALNEAVEKVAKRGVTATYQITPQCRCARVVLRSEKPVADKVLARVREEFRNALESAYGSDNYDVAFISKLRHDHLRSVGNVIQSIEEQMDEVVANAVKRGIGVDYQLLSDIGQVYVMVVGGAPRIAQYIKGRFEGIVGVIRETRFYKVELIS